MALLVDWRYLLLILSFISHATSSPSRLAVLPVSYQSGGITFVDWISILTLCFTPLLVHVIAGIPDTVCFSVPRKHLRWHHRICHYNPTTIIWRYFAIADRRLRAKKWDATHLAASNALFWTQRGWDGSEEMIERSRPYCIKPPEATRTLLLSKSSFKTLIVTLEGLQSISTLIGSFNGQLEMAKTLSIGSIFFPLSVLGLLRLCAAPWLTDEFVYEEYDEREHLATSITGCVTPPEIRRKPLPVSVSQISLEHGNPSYDVRYSKDAASLQMTLLDKQATSQEVLLEPAVSAPDPNFHRTTSWRGLLFRVLFMTPILLLVAVCFYYLIPWTVKKSSPWAYHLSATLFLLTLLYLVLMTFTFFIFTYYLLRDVPPTTVIPCLVSIWYQIYTLGLAITTVLLIIIAAIETRKSPCGVYTSWPAAYNVCHGTLVQPNATSLPFGIAMRYAVSGNETKLLPSDEIRIAEFSGWCVGNEGASHLVAAGNITKV